jgi:hypothetical protein
MIFKFRNANKLNFIRFQNIYNVIIENKHFSCFFISPKGLTFDRWPQNRKIFCSFLFMLTLNL